MTESSPPLLWAQACGRASYRDTCTTLGSPANPLPSSLWFPQSHSPGCPRASGAKHHHLGYEGPVSGESHTGQRATTQRLSLHPSFRRMTCGQFSATATQREAGGRTNEGKGSVLSTEAFRRPLGWAFAERPAAAHTGQAGADVGQLREKRSEM